MIKIKSQITNDLERSIRKNTINMSTFGCMECTIGFNGKERVDYITMDTKGIFRCYEIKSCLADFHSKSKHTFLGHYNYYVFPYGVYEFVKDEIPFDVGVFEYGTLIKRPKKREVYNTDTLKDSMIRSLFRDSNKLYELGKEQYIQRLENNNKKYQKLLKEIKNNA